MQHKQLPYIIDIEASGFGSNSYPIEVGVIINDGLKYCSLVKPSKDWTHWDKNAEQIHHISRISLKTNGKSAATVAKQLNEFLEGMTVYSDGWVVDQPWLTRLFEAARTPMRFKISPLETLLSESQMAIWHETKDKVVEEMDMPRHRASNDAAIIQETFIRTLELTSAA